MTGKALAQLAVAVVVGLVITVALRTGGSVGMDVGDRPFVQAVSQDRSSPTAENALADVTLIVFTDYQCPACRAAHPEMVRAVAEDGRVRVVYKDWPIFGEASEHAARAAIASAYQGIYPSVHDALMSGSRFDDRMLRNAVEQAGGSWGRLQDDLARNRTSIDEQLARNKRQAFGLGLGGTPGYLIGDILVRGALDEARFLKAFGEARETG